MFGVLLLHSFGSTNAEMIEFSDYLENQGFHTNAPMLPGHGTTSNDLQNYSYKDWIDFCLKEIKKLKCQGVFLIGQTTSVPLILNIAANHPEFLGISTLSGIISLNYWKRLMQPILRLPYLYPWKTGTVNIPINSPELWNQLNGYMQIPRKSLYELYYLTKETQRILYQINQPIFIFHSNRTHKISSIDSQQIFHKVSSQKKKLMYIEKGGTLMSVDTGKNIVFREVTNFFWSAVDLWQM